MCLIPSGITNNDTDCNGTFGGLLKVYLANEKEVETIAKNASNVITGVTLSGGAKFYEFEYDDSIGAGLEEELQPDAGGFVQQTLNFTLRNITQDKKNILSKMKRGKFIALVEESTGKYKLAGEGRALRSVTTTITRGQAAADLAGATLSLQGQSLDYADEVSSTLISSLIA